MGKGVKVVLALAIALVFPVMVGLFIYLVIPDSKNITEPKYPEYPSQQQYCYSNNYKNYYQSNSYDSCSKTLAEIDKKQRADYDNQLKEYNKLKNSSESNRIKASLAVVILGFMIASFSGGFSSLAVGMAGGSTLLLLVSTGLLAGIADSIDAVMIGLYLGSFAVLMFLLFRIDLMFPEPEIIEPIPQAPDLRLPNNSNELKK